MISAPNKLLSVACPQGTLPRRPGLQAACCQLQPRTEAQLAAGLLSRPSPVRSFKLLQPRLRPPSRSRGQQQVVAASRPDVADRVVGSLPYLIPLFDGLRYGKFFFLQFPSFGQILVPLEPLIRLYFSVPFAGLVVFFGVYLGVIQNYRFSRFVRYNAMQAILLDVILILPGLIESIFRPPMSGPGLQIYITGYNTIWLFVFFCVTYGVGSCLVGQTARLPIVADAADAQVR